MSKPFTGTNLEWCQRHLFHGFKRQATHWMTFGGRSITPLCDECTTYLENNPVYERKGSTAFIAPQITHYDKEAT